ncbi:hypothetical protein [Kordia sp.]|uniref:hypothetical protein n=1 Tax=Kordia sp. TaxID=1965332 RepID=UPI003D2B239D
MGLFDFLSSKPTEKKQTEKLVNYVYNIVKNDSGVRVEDAICLSATIVAERCIVLADEYNINKHDFEPGSAIFSDKINELLAGSVAVENWSDVPSESIFGTIRDKIKSKFPIASFPSVIAIFENYAQYVGTAEWGNIPLTVPKDNAPFLFPLRAGYESRKYVEKHVSSENNTQSLSIAINALTHILIETKTAINSSVALSLTFELINGMSKMATMTDDKMNELNATLNG